MNRLIYSFLLLSCAASALVSCTDDPTQDLQLSTSEGETWVTLDFGDNSFEEINITTRTTLNGAAESRVSNLFVFLFDADGKRVYGRLFDRSNRKDSKIDLLDSHEECWWVKGNSQAERTQGKVRMYAPAITNGTLYILSNVSADMVNISPEKLRFIETLDDLKAMTATLNQKITERNGFFPMTGKVNNITISADGGISSNVPESFPVKLTRIDAKITVKVRAAAGYKGTSEDEKTSHTIKEFVPLSWQVVNLPRSTYVLPSDEATVDTEAKREFFNTRAIKFETRKPDDALDKFLYDHDNDPETPDVPGDVHGFSFYMLENRPKAKNESLIKPDDPKDNPNGYHLRDKRKKYNDPDNPDKNGTYDTSSGLWEHAPEEATYLIIKGEVLMDLDVSDETKDQQLSANVVYYIHLGDFANNLNDYNVERNTSYTYTITIYGVDNIQTEVEKETEGQSGAMGHVYVAKESIYTFDAHFGRTVAFFDEKHLTNVDDLTWYVSTPFGREGTPHIINGVEVPAGLDYQWVHFMINSHVDGDVNKPYNTKHEAYDPKKTMNILEFSNYIKDQKRRYEHGEPNDFRLHSDPEWGKEMRNRIYVTIFVDEFYYTADPITGDVRQDLWKDFVNQPNRMLHILCNSDVSKDEDSRSTGSVVTIRQRSIQTIFNTENPKLKTAWGCETIDETRDSLWFYSRNESYKNDGTWVPSPDVHISYEGNWSDFNGLFNTVRLWGLMISDHYDVNNKKNWNDYIDYEQRYNLVDKDLTETLRYACLTRNRDENGDGKIDAAEIKWYMAAINQLAALYVGDQGLNSEAALYPYYKQVITSSKMEANNSYPWRSHIVSSTAFSSGILDEGGYEYRAGDPAVLWAEEGLSTGPYKETYGKSARLTVRCLRNLGMDPTSEDDAQKMLEKETDIPEKAIKASEVELNGTTIYKFDMTNMNPLSIRYYTSRELEPNDEFSMEARVYWAFETGSMTDKAYTYDELYNLLMEGKSPCPEGYRVPNVREAALMTLNCPPAWQRSPTRVSTYYSHGTAPGKPYGGTGLDNSPSWLFDSNRTRLDDQLSYQIRCVRDIRQ